MLPFGASAGWRLVDEWFEIVFKKVSKKER